MEYQEDLLNYLSSFLTEQRKDRLHEVAEWRTRHITVVLEDIYQSHNASAVLRSADCFGIQDVHIIENRNTYDINPDVALGSSKWLSLYKYNQEEDNTRSCLLSLRESGYQLVATSPHTDDISLKDFPLDQPIALLFGTELSGLSDAALELADQRLRIPMYGFTESFNISVSVALCLYDLTQRLRSSEVEWALSDAEKKSLLLDWTRTSVKSSVALEREFLRKKVEERRHE